MVVMIHDETECERLIAERKARGGDQYDEVWEGIYVMNPHADNEHQRLVAKLCDALMRVWDHQELGETFGGANISDQSTDWTRNYRVPDVLCFSNDCSAIDRGSHWYGGPEFAIEITSPGDRTLEKLDFYAAVGTKGLLVVDRDPWCLTLYQVSRGGKGMHVAAKCDRANPVWIESGIVPVKFKLAFEPNLLSIANLDGELMREIPFAN